MRAKLYRFTKDARKLVRHKGAYRLASFSPNKSKVSDLHDSLKALTNLPIQDNIPTWLDDNELDSKAIVACANGLLHLPSGGLLKHTPLFFNHNGLGFSYLPDAPGPTSWLGLLRELWSDG